MADPSIEALQKQAAAGAIRLISLARGLRGKMSDCYRGGADLDTSLTLGGGILPPVNTTGLLYEPRQFFATTAKGWCLNTEMF